MPATIDLKKFLRSLFSRTATKEPDAQSPQRLGLGIPEVRGTGMLRWDRGRPLAAGHPYYVYTKRFDEVVCAADLMDSQQFDGALATVEAKAAGMLIANASTIDQLKKFLDDLPSEKETSVQIVLDNSNSLGGEPIACVAAACLAVLSLIENPNIKTELLGFTTVAWRGGRSRELWLADGRMSYPGRLNDLRHIIYKSFEDENDILRKSVPLMVTQGILKENIDGEALIWAATRLLSYRSQRKIMIVVSDGAPVDDSTIAQNGNFLSPHLRQVIALISSYPIQLFGISIDHHRPNFPTYKLSEYIVRSKVTQNPEHSLTLLAETLIDALNESDSMGEAAHMQSSIPPGSPRQ